jgi:hypothetical protein
LTLQHKDADVEDQGADDDDFDEDEADSFVHEAGISAKKRPLAADNREDSSTRTKAKRIRCEGHEGGETSWTMDMSSNLLFQPKTWKSTTRRKKWLSFYCWESFFRSTYRKTKKTSASLRNVRTIFGFLCCCGL